MSHSQNEDKARQRESKAILERVKRETEPQIGGHTEAMLFRTRDHLMARDADQKDRIEVLGTRIGRWAAIVGFVIFATMLAAQFAGG